MKEFNTKRFLIYLGTLCGIAAILYSVLLPLYFYQKNNHLTLLIGEIFISKTTLLNTIGFYVPIIFATLIIFTTILCSSFKRNMQIATVFLFLFAFLTTGFALWATPLFNSNNNAFYYLTFETRFEKNIYITSESGLLYFINEATDNKSFVKEITTVHSGFKYFTVEDYENGVVINYTYRYSESISKVYLRYINGHFVVDETL